ncbi:hypothetical protein [Psychroserpens damuponensis]|uniref:hypothetical protein n=1 Tax=Psychroserpens damuponensis TaxID=943936 RepID=UPI00058E8ECE|nr:hypothetical protein [Psychroserpens damuponensis]
MTCQQKSGVFLNINCDNTKEKTCYSCEKEVCHTHSHKLEGHDLCEDCYWEIFLLSAQPQQDHSMGQHDDTIIVASTPHTTTNPNTSTPSQPEGFGDGFGGGGFSGGGAGASWTEGDMQSVTDTDAIGNSFTANGDDTFFYS